METIETLPSRTETTETKIVRREISQKHPFLKMDSSFKLQASSNAIVFDYGGPRITKACGINQLSRECPMRVDTKIRDLSNAEKALATSVFQSSLPAWRRIKITDGLGPIPNYDNPYTTEDSPYFYLHLGPDVYPDATLTKYLPGFGAYRSVFIHEMTHVWQYYHGYWVVLRSLWANTLGAGYNYTVSVSDAWDDYNVEQQAQLVEDWFAGGMSKTDDRFVFIEKIVRAGITGGFWADFKDTFLVKLPIEKLRQV